MRKAILLAALMAGIATLTGVLGTGKALAYGPGAVAQVEVSGNCTNVTFCNTNFGGTGGLWIWAALQSDHTADATFAGCGHTVGGGGPGSAGGGGGPQDGTWTTASNLFEAAFTDGAFPLGIQLDKNGSPDMTVPYYVITLNDPHFGPFVFAVPVQTGHYSYSGLQFINQVPVGTHIPGVNFQTQVAP
jgi:hypothetical protein